MKKLGLVIVIILFSMMLSGCKEEDIEVDFSLILESNGEIIDEYTGLTVGKTLDLPVMEKEGHIFLGWSDGEELYYDEYTYQENITLEAVYEDIDEVFTFEVQNDVIMLTDYHGSALVLKIPVYIDGYIVRMIDQKAFEETNLIRVEIPVSVSYIGHRAFSKMEALEEVVFYGDYIGEEETLLGSDDYEEMIGSSASVCEKEIISERNWTFNEGCPIKEVINHTDPVEVNGEEIITYSVILDYAYYDNEENQHYISFEAFYELPKLKSVDLPPRYRDFEGNIFSSTPALEKLTFKDNDSYQMIDGVLYTEGGTVLKYYPPWKEATSFTIPSEVVSVDELAFYGNQTLENITLDSHFSPTVFNRYVFLEGLSVLEEVTVIGDEGPLTSIDGVLYFFNDDRDFNFLIYYPPMKEETSYKVEDNMHGIDSSIFEDNLYLEEVLVPSSLSSLSFYSLIESNLKRVIVYESAYQEEGMIYLGVVRSYEEIHSPKIYFPEDMLGWHLTNDRWNILIDFLYSVETLDVEIDDLYDYEIIEGYAVIHQYLGSNAIVKVPSSLGGYPVEVIMSDAFTKEGIVEVYIPSSVKTLEESAINGILSLEKIIFYGGYTESIPVSLSLTKIEEIEEANSDVCVRTDESPSSWRYTDGCIMEDVWKEEISMAGQMRTIYRVSLALTFYEALDPLYVDNSAFSDLVSLKEIRFLRTGDVLGDIEGVNIYSIDRSRYYALDGVVYSHEKELIQYGLLDPYTTTRRTSYSIKEDTTTIGEFAFSGVHYLEEIYIPESVTEIKDFAFSEMENVMSIVIPSSVEFLGSNITYQSSVEYLILERSIIEDGSITHTSAEYYQGMPFIYVPDDSYEAYLADPVWGELSYYIRPMSELE